MASKIKNEEHTLKEETVAILKLKHSTIFIDQECLDDLIKAIENENKLFRTYNDELKFTVVIPMFNLKEIVFIDKEDR